MKRKSFPIGLGVNCHLWLNREEMSNMRNGFNQFSVPYMNELTARGIGAASNFGGNMPLGYINFSLDQIAGWLSGQGRTAPQSVSGAINTMFQDQQPQQQPRITSGSVWDRVAREYEEWLKRTGIVLPQAPQAPEAPTAPRSPDFNPNAQSNCPPGEKEYYDILGFKRCGKPMISDGRGTLGDDPTHSGQKAGAIADVGGFLFGDFLGSDLGKDLAKRVGLIILGALLLLLAIYGLMK